MYIYKGSKYSINICTLGFIQSVAPKACAVGNLALLTSIANMRLAFLITAAWITARPGCIYIYIDSKIIHSILYTILDGEYRVI